MVPVTILGSRAEGCGYNWRYMSLVVVGSVAYDGVETPHGKVDRMLGGACTYISLAASYFTHVKIVAVVGDDFDAGRLSIFWPAANIDLGGLERFPGKTFFWAGVYSADMNDRTTLRTDLNVFADFKPKLPECYRDAPYLLLGNIQPALQRSVREQMNGTAPRRRRHHELLDQRLSRGAARNPEGLGLPADQRQRSAAALGRDTTCDAPPRRSWTWGRTRWSSSAASTAPCCSARDRYFMVPGYLLEDVFDPTGAGDCFAGGFIGYLAEQRRSTWRAARSIRRQLRRAVIYGSVMGSFCCEQFGVDRFRTLTRAEIDARFQEFKSFTEF